MSNGTSSALRSEQDLASIPMAEGRLTRLVVARLKSAGVPVAPILRRVGLTPELIADPEERLYYEFAAADGAEPRTAAP